MQLLLIWFYEFSKLYNSCYIGAIINTVRCSGTIMFDILVLYNIDDDDYLKFVLGCP